MPHPVLPPANQHVLRWASLAIAVLLAVAIIRHSPVSTELDNPATVDAHTRITTDVTWGDDIRPILRQHCMRCHSPGGAAPPYADFTTYGTDSNPGARAWAAAIEEELLTGRMPPWTADERYGRFSNARTLSKDERDILVAWVGGGAPQGPRRNLPPPPEFLDDAWELGAPDITIKPTEPTALADGQDATTVTQRYQGLVEQDSWITGYEFKPDSVGAVQRMTAWIIDDHLDAESLEVEIQQPYDPFRDEAQPEPTRMRPNPEGRKLLGQYLPGDAPVLLPAGTGKRLRAGSIIEVETEYRRRTFRCCQRHRQRSITARPVPCSDHRRSGPHRRDSRSRQPRPCPQEEAASLPTSG